MRQVRPEYRAAREREELKSSAVPAPVPILIPKRRPRIDTAINASCVEVDAMRAQNDFSQAEPRHFVALYWRLHEHVYRVEPLELEDARAWGNACVAVAQLLSGMFRGDRGDLARFMAWAWGREVRRPSQRRMGWRLQFSATFVTDYRVQQNRGQRQ